jgi:predicted RNA-binding protein with PUA-like domain
VKNGTACAIIRRAILCRTWHWEIGVFATIHKKAIIGVVEVIALAHPYVTSDDLCWEFLDIKAFSVVDPPATLAQIKHDPRLSAMMLVKNPRLSVQPVSAAHWRIIGSLTPNSSL